MRFAYLVLAFILSSSVMAQDITFQYKNASGVTVDPIPIKKDTKQIILENAVGLQDFKITVIGLTANNQILFFDKNDVQIGGPYLPVDVNKSYHSPATLNNKSITIYHIDANSIKTIYATITLLDKLPNSQLNVTTALASWMAAIKTVCVPCDESGRALIYDFSKNSLTRRSTSQWPKVNDPYKFIVKNINPFRDSVIVSQETANYNTDVPDLFTKAFFSTALKGANPDEAAILADVLALGDQIDAIINTLKQSKECDDICSVIQSTKNAVEKHFHDNYKFDVTKTDLISFITGELQNINDVYKEKVTAVLTNYKAFYNARNYFSYYIPQIQNVDAYIFTLSILPKSSAQLASIVDHQPITVPTVWGWKFDFSSGLFVTGLRDQRFFLKPDSTVIHNNYGGDSIIYNRRNQIIQQTDNNKVDFGVSALMHFYPRISRAVNISLSLGAGLSIGPNPAIRYLGGGSLLLGRSGRFIVTYGCAAGFVDELSDTYQNGQFVSISDKTALTKKVFKTRGFWGFSFNIPLFKSKVDTNATKDDVTADNSSSGDTKSTTDDKTGKGK